MISHACPIIVLDDERDELWQVAHGVSFCGLPVMSHLVTGGDLERKPAQPYTGIRLLFTDLHLLGPSQSKPEQYVSALIRFIRQLISPSTYLIVFWSNYAEEANEAWKHLIARIPPELKPFGYAILSKEDAKAAADHDPEISEPAIHKVQASVESIINQYPQLQAVMEWESNVSRSAAETTNELVRMLKAGGIEFDSRDSLRAVMARMAQEALGYPHAPTSPAKGLSEALLPISQEWLERHLESSSLDAFLAVTSAERIELPTQELAPLLNDFFIHSEHRCDSPLDRGAVTRLAVSYLEEKDGFLRDIGPDVPEQNWRDAVGSEFAMNWTRLENGKREEVRSKILQENIYAVELSAECDHAQNKPRSQRFMVALFVPSSDAKLFYSSKGFANESIYSTPDITIGTVKGKLLVSCRLFLSRRHGVAVEGAPVTRLRRDVVSEIAHHYSSHMRRPGKIAFF